MHGVGKSLRAIVAFFRALVHWEVTLIVLGVLVLLAVLVGSYGKFRKGGSAADVRAEEPSHGDN